METAHQDNEGIPDQAKPMVPKKKLYAIAIEKRTRIMAGPHRGRLMVIADIQYLHADDDKNAHFLFCLAYPNRYTHHIVSIGVAIAYFVNDKKGIQLSVS